MSSPKAKKQAKAVQLPGGSLPDIFVWPLLIVIPLICLVGAWTTPPVATPDELKAAVGQILLTGILLWYFWSRRRDKQTVLHFSAPVWAFTALFLIGTLSVVWSINPDFWFYKWSRWYAAFVIFLLGMQIRQTTINLDRVFHACLWGGVITAAIGIAQHLFGLSIIPQTSPPSSTFGNGNMAGEIMIFTAPIGVYFMVKPDLSKRAAWFYSLAIAVILLYTFYTRTRAVWLAVSLETALVALFIILDPRRSSWLHWDRNRTLAATVMTLMFLTLTNFSQKGFQPFYEVAAYELGSIVTDIGDNQGNDASPRYLIWSSTLQMIKDDPLIGTGVGSFFEKINNGGYSNYRIFGVQRVHNDVLELAVDLGMLGILCLLAIIVTFCRQLYQLFLYADGKYRLVCALLTFGVTGSMLDAQLSFPYELPVPLVMMGLYMAIVIRNGEFCRPESVRSFNIGAWFNKAATAASVVMLVAVSIINGQWLYDFRVLNRMMASTATIQEWKPVSRVFSQAHITIARSVADAFEPLGLDQAAVDILKPALEYWPDAAPHTLLMAQFTLKLKRFDEAEQWARKTILAEPADTYLGEMQLINNYWASGRLDKAREIYNQMKQVPEESLSAYENTLNIMHYTSINLGDYAMTTTYYAMFVHYHGLRPNVEVNQAIYHYNTGSPEGALWHLRKAVELNPRMEIAPAFRKLLADNVNLQIDPPVLESCVYPCDD